MDFKIEDLNSYQFVWKNNGMHPVEMDDSTGSNVRLKVEDAIAGPNAGMWLPKGIQNIVKEAA